MRKTVLIGLVACGVAACTPADKDDTYAIACASIPTADALFQVYASTGKVKQSLIDAERQAIAAAQAICNGPRPTNVQQSITAVNRAATAILQLIAQAKAQAQAGA